MEIKTSLIKRILFFRTDRIGDFLVNLPTLEVLKQTFPTASITVVLNPVVKNLVEGHHAITTPVPFSTCVRPSFIEWIKLYLFLRKSSYDIAIVSNPHKYFHLLTWILKIPVRVGYNRKWKCFLNHRSSSEEKEWGFPQHQVWYNFKLLSPLLGGSYPLPVVSLPISEQDRKQLQMLIENENIPQKPFIVISPFSTHKDKEWPVSHYLTLAKKLSEDKKYFIILMGGPEDEDKLISVPLSPGIYNLCGKLSLRNVATLLRDTHLLISNDSGPVHIAACVQTKTVVLYGRQNKGSSPVRWGAHWNGGNTTDHRSIVKDFISDITVEEVWSMVKEIF